MVSPNVDTFSYTERRGLHVFLVCIAGHVVLHFLHSVMEELVHFIKIDCKVAHMKVGDFSI